MRIVTHVLLTTLGLFLAAYIIPGIAVDSLLSAFVAAVILGIVNLTVKPLLFLLTLPITLITFGLFTFVINAAMFALAAFFVEGFSVGGFLPALLGSVLVTLFSSVAYKLIS